MRLQGTTADSSSATCTETGTTTTQKAAPGRSGGGYVQGVLLLGVVLVSTQGLIKTIIVDPNKYADVRTTSLRTSSDDVVATDPPTLAPTTTSNNNATTTSLVAAAPTPWCGQTPWTEHCAEWYNTGKWIVLPEPIEWNQTYSARSMEWQSSRQTSPSECQRVGTSLQWRSTTQNIELPVWDADRFLRAVGPHKRITIVGDSVARQHYATLLEALGTDHIRNCTKFDHDYWGPQLPSSCRTTNNVTIHVVQDNYGSWDEGVGPYDGGIRGKSYIGTMADQDYFRESDLIVMSFGVWYYEQVGTGVKTNHTPATYIRHMRTLVDDIALHRQPHQLIVWRETTGPRKRKNHEAIKAANRLL
jgi:hypothetical protein